MGNLFKYILAGIIGWIVWRWVKRSRRKAERNATAKPKTISDLAYCGVCNSYVSSDTACGRGDCPKRN
jgi:hypothetical protein